MKKIPFYLVFFLFGAPVLGSGAELDFHKRSITDDEIAAAIKPHGPASVTDLTNKIERDITEGDEGYKIVSLDVSQNNLTLVGATQLLDFLAKNSTSLEDLALNLSFNRIRYAPDDVEYPMFEESLRRVLDLPSFKSVDLNNNYLGIEWYRHIVGKLTNSLAEKICWQ